MSLDDNLRAAKKAAMKVRKSVPNSSNTAWTSSPVISTGGVAPKTSGLMPAIWGLFFADTVPSSSGAATKSLSSSLNATVRSSGKAKLQSDSRSGWRASGRSGRNAPVSRLAIVASLAAIACLELRDAQVATPVEYVQIWDGVTQNPALPHLVAVIGRRPIFCQPTTSRWASRHLACRRRDLRPVGIEFSTLHTSTPTTGGGCAASRSAPTSSPVVCFIRCRLFIAAEVARCARPARC